ncbi:MAG: phosphatase [Pseudonocardiales bacterium]|nr:phosphatase [Pseudonocardiales bacterium]
MTSDLPEALFEGRTFAAVLFDLDGTLVDSTAMVNQAWTSWAHAYGIADAGPWIRHGVPAPATVRAVIDAGLIDAGELDRAVALIDRIEIEAARDGTIPVLPGAREALAAIPSTRAAIVTSCSLPLALARLHAAGLSATKVMVTADQLERGKPDPQGYQRAAEQLGVAPANCLVVEDAPAGVAAGRAAGASVLAVVTTTKPAELGDAQVIVEDLGQVEFLASTGGVRAVRRPTRTT